VTLDIWAACADQVSKITLVGEVVRIAGSQEQMATNRLVDDLAEQAILENLLEQTKPSISDFAQKLNYLLYTPFRYPPLKHGSRFGRRFEPSLFYGSRKLSTVLSETAYYRLYFWLGMTEPPPSAKLTTQHTAFSARVSTTQGLQLQNTPFSTHKDKLANKSSYSDTQLLGTLMRDNGIKAFEFVSARDLDEGLNIALFTPDALHGKSPTSTKPLLCTTDSEGVAFIYNKNKLIKFPLHTFMENGVFPAPILTA